MATIPPRRPLFRKALASLADQVGTQFVWFDQMTSVSDVPIPHGIEFSWGHKGAGGKFHKLQEECPEGYHIIADDDLVYPPGYVAYLCARLDFYRKRHGRAIVGIHGWSFPSTPRDITDRRTPRPCLGTTAFEHDAYVNVLGTGTLCCHSADLTGFTQVDFTTPRNLVDLRFAVWGQQQQIPFIALARPASYLEHLLGPRDWCLWHEWWAGRGVVRPEKRKTLESVIREVAQWKVFDDPT